MWSNIENVGGITNAITLPVDGIVEVKYPKHVKLSAYINDAPTELHHLHVKAGDKLHFKLDGHDSSIPSTVEITYNGNTSSLYVSTPEHKSSVAVEEYSTSQKENKMSHKYEDLNIFSNPMGGYGMSGVGAGAGAGLGAGLLGGVLGGVLLNRNGLLGNGDNIGNFVTPTQLQTGLDAVTAQNQNTTILQSLGDIKAAIPLAESQVQLALAGAQNDINAQINTSTSNILNNQTGIARDIATTTATILAANGATQDVVQNGIASVNLGIANLATSGLQNTYALNSAIRDDGDKTRALIVSQNDANLQRMLAVAEAQLAEQRATSRARDIEVNVTQTVNQNQMQLQQQQQAQQQLILLSNLAATINGLQSAVATNSNLIVGNTGAVATGAQTANPVNVRT